MRSIGINDPNKYIILLLVPYHRIKLRNQKRLMKLKKGGFLNH